MKKNETYIISNPRSNTALITSISKIFLNKQEAKKVIERVYFDTFDWRLYKNGYSLFRCENSYKLMDLESEAICIEQIITKSNVPKFWWDFPNDRLRNSLKKTIDLRALIRTVKTEIVQKFIRILNKDEKTVAKLSLNSVYLIENKKKKLLTNQLKVIQVKGYPKPFRRVCNHLANCNLEIEQRPLPLLAFEGAGHRFDCYTLKINERLSPVLNINVALKKVLKYSLEIIKINESGIKHDLDTEFLHEFRIAIRKTRSTLSQIKDIFPTQIVNQVKNDFSTICHYTNYLRDLDVYLFKEKEYLAKLPKELQTGLSPLFDYLSVERKKEHQQVLKFLESDFYSQAIKSWTVFLNSSNVSSSNDVPDGNYTALKVARVNLKKKYNQILNIGRSIHDETPDERIHKLRLACKQLRYLLEIFSSLFSSKKIVILSKQLKKLQDNLGLFTNYSVQITMLKNYLDKLILNKKNSVLETAAIGVLISELNHEKKNVRNAFQREFKHFSAKININLFRALLSNNKKEAIKI
ncbi:MAG: CHAD domain-containing protein [Ignavibacteria bacterium]|nr:CHAD domain-containing protein [Ignavibacteria bacterium]